jgi:hypothetical protein
LFGSLSFQSISKLTETANVIFSINALRYDFVQRLFD